MANPKRRLPISEIIGELANIKTKQGKIEWLKAHDSIPLRQILRINYDSSVEWLLPDTPPPWKNNPVDDAQRDGLFYTEARRLKIFIKDGGYNDLNQVKREGLFISLLEDLDNADAKLLSSMLAKKPFKGLTLKTLEEAFPNVLQTKIVG